MLTRPCVGRGDVADLLAGQGAGQGHRVLQRPPLHPREDDHLDLRLVGARSRWSPRTTMPTATTTTAATAATMIFWLRDTVDPRDLVRTRLPGPWLRMLAGPGSTGCSGPAAA